MLKLTIDILQPGMVLGKPITDNRGRTLLRQGIALTDDYISVLKQRDIAEVFVLTEDANDVVVDSLLSEETHHQAQQAVAQIFAMVRQLAEEFTKTEKRPVDEMPADSEVVEHLRFSPNFEQLETTSKTILNELLKRNSLKGSLSQIRSRSKELFSHSVNVAATAILIGQALKLSGRDLERLGTACLLHDIGKIFFEPALTKFNEQSPPSARHLKLRDHTRLGYELLRSRDSGDVMVNHSILSHHERQDGKGYPRGLRGTNTVERPRFDRESILLITEIVSVADVYDILSRSSPHRPQLTARQIAATMRRLTGTFLNKEIVNIFLLMLPVLPAGINIIVRTGRYANYKGVVTQANKEIPDRPTVRLLNNPAGGPITPIHLKLASKEDVIVEATF